MPSLFAGTDRLICRALGINDRRRLNDRTQHLEPLSEEGASRLVDRLYTQLVSNASGRITARSEQLWQCRRATQIADHNCSPETLLEKAVAQFADQGHMPLWFNQCPVASGISDSNSDRRRAVDLVHLSGETARLVELKWASDTPVHALFQLLEYGLAYSLARFHMAEAELGLDDRPLMHVRHVGLELVAPCTYFSPGSWPDLFARLDKALAGFVQARSGNAWSMSLQSLSFPRDFRRVPFADGRDVNAKCRTRTLTDEGRIIRDAFSGLVPAPTQAPPRFLPGVPGPEIERILAAAPGDEIGSGKFDNPESSAALATNALGFFLQRAADLPPLPVCPDAAWPVRSIILEATVRFPWAGGRHPVLDCLIATPSVLIGIESKRFEPFRDKCPADFSDAYWRSVWGDHMEGYQRVRDGLRENPSLYSFLNAVQLVKHAFALRTQVHRPGAHHGLKPILFYVHAEPDFWPGTGHTVDDHAKADHRKEIADFARRVAGDEVAFASCTWQHLLGTWRSSASARVRAHADAVAEHFMP